MVQGVSRQVIVVRTPDPRFFEQAIFIVKEDAFKKGVTAEEVLQEALNGADPSGGAIYYFNPDTSTSAWIWSRPLITVIGKHRFCS